MAVNPDAASWMMGGRGPTFVEASAFVPRGGTSADRTADRQAPPLRAGDPVVIRLAGRKNESKEDS